MEREIVLKFRSVNRDTFEAIKSGKKKVETRAATDRYRSIRKGDIIVFTCGKSKFTRVVREVELFRSIAAILKKYKPEEINPSTKTANEARKMWHSFPGYDEKIRKYGLIALTIK